jgi:hypothetical protein
VGAEKRRFQGERKEEKEWVEKTKVDMERKKNTNNLKKNYLKFL